MGDVVLARSEDKRRLTWLIGLPTKVLPGNNGVIRIVHVKTKNGVLVRPIHRFNPLEIADVSCGRILRDSSRKGEVC